MSFIIFWPVFIYYRGKLRLPLISNVIINVKVVGCIAYFFFKLHNNN